MPPGRGAVELNARELRQKLRALGLTNEVVDLAWPSWWSDDAEASPSARAELRFTLARKLGLDPKALLETDEPRFVWKVGTFKNLSSATSEVEREALISYATSLGRVLLSAVPGETGFSFSAQEVRRQLMKRQPFVSLQSLLSLCWAVGLPVVHLNVLPSRAKRMCAMAVNVRGRHVIFLAKESRFPAQLAYYVAHELGHIALGHLSTVPSLVDEEDPLRSSDKSDPDELAADRFALEVLTGDPEPRILPGVEEFSGAALAKTASEAAGELQIEPGTIALCIGHASGKWDKVTTALKRIYGMSELVGPVINRVALGQVGGHLSDESDEYLRAAFGEPA